MANTFRERVAAAEAASRMEELKLQEVRRGYKVLGRFRQLSVGRCQLWGELMGNQMNGCDMLGCAYNGIRSKRLYRVQVGLFNSSNINLHPIRHTV